MEQSRPPFSPRSAKLQPYRPSAVDEDASSRRALLSPVFQAIPSESYSMGEPVLRSTPSVKSDAAGDVADGTNGEPPKYAFSTTRRRSLSQFLLFQFPSAAVTGTLLGLHIYNFYWSPGANDVGALLFAAKVHESLIVASLFHIVYYHIRRGLLSSHGIPFGYLTLAFQLNSPFYLASSGFLAPFLRCRPATLYSISLAALVLVTFVLAALAGASSGIVMLPKPGWWEMPVVQINRTMANNKSFRASIVSPIDSLYPAKVDISTIPVACNTSKGGTEVYCPFYHFSNPESSAWGWYSELGSVSSPTNLTISYRRGKEVSFYNKIGVYDLAAATCPLDSVADLLESVGHGWQEYPAKLSIRLSNQDNVQIALKQPRVAIQCTDYPDAGQTNPYAFHMLRGFYPDFRFVVDESIMAPAYRAFRSGATFGFIDVAKYLPVHSSAVFWAKFHDYAPTLALCLVDARWLETDTWIVPSAGSIPAQHNVKLDNKTLDYSKNPEQVIDLDLAWLNALNGTMEKSKLRKTNSTAHGTFDMLLDFISPQYAIYSLGEALAVVLVDALSIVPSSKTWLARGSSPSGPWPESTDQGARTLVNLPSYAKIEIIYEHNVYQYNFQGISTKLAWAVLLLHLLLVLVHLVTLLAQGTWSSSAWSELGELVVLAANSAPNALLRNTGVRVKKWDIWRLTAFVREAAAGDRVELVLRDGVKTAQDDGDSMAEVPSSRRKYG